jgi:hypothetical protein
MRRTLTRTKCRGHEFCPASASLAPKRAPGLVTLGVGCLIDPVSLALPLPWRHAGSGELATRAEVAAAWNGLKSQKDKFTKLHFKYAAALNDLRLDDAGVDQLMTQRLLTNEKVLHGYFPQFDLFPADAQLAIFSMAWAVGAGFPQQFGNFRAAANAQNWTSAIAACGIRTDGNAGIVPRNAANRLCLANAQSVLSQGIPLDTLFWPGTAPNASQREEALKTEAELAAADHAAHNAKLWDKLTTDLYERLDLRHDRNDENNDDDSPVS